MIMCVLLCYPVSIHMSQLLSTGRPISSILVEEEITSIIQIYLPLFLGLSFLKAVLVYI